MIEVEEWDDDEELPPVGRLFTQEELTRAACKAKAQGERRARRQLEEEMQQLRAERDALEMALMRRDEFEKLKEERDLYRDALAKKLEEEKQ